ncbi:MAG: T9SS type A sorting domain-containing protein [Flavobacteriales bacterium]
MKLKLYSGVLLWLMFGTFPNVLSAQNVNVSAPLFSDIVERVDKEAELNGRDMAGVVIESEMDFFDFASFTVLENGLSEWSLDIESTYAMGLCVYFNDFHIPVGGSLLFQSEAGVFSTLYQEGPIRSDENNGHGRWASADIPGDQIRIIYRQASSSIGSARLGIMGIGYFVRGVSRGSDDCEVDVMCPEGDSWQCERDATVRLRVTQDGGIFYCSGYDCRQLLLSAFHCADAVDEDEWAYLKVRYNYEYTECGGTVSVNSHARTGVIPLTNSDDASAQGFNGSDFLLVEVEDAIPETWNPFYAGFDASGETGHIGVGIHHPAGDRKKISNYTNPLTSYNIGGAGSHWRVYWTATETDHGVTEGGSSGSAIFSENHHIVGTLSSGLSACVVGGVGNGTGPYSPDFYGKMSYHWDGPNPIAASQKLKNFLDPSGSGQTIVNGSYVGEGAQPCGNFGACSATEAAGLVLENQGWSLSPNPASGSVEISMPSGAPLVELRVYDARGRMLESRMPDLISESLSFDVSHLSKGLHFFTVRTSDGTSSTLKLVIE